jgi:hypothetical protein
MVRFLEAVEPLWIPPRLNLQTLEFAAAWRLFWGHRQTLDFNPIGLLNEMVASMGSPARSTRDLRAAIAEFESNAVRKHMEDSLDPKHLIGAQNKADFERGRFDRGLRYTTDRQFAALHIARLRGLRLDDPRLEQVRAGLLIDARTSVEIDFFLDFGGRTDLKAAEVEWQLTLQLYATPAQLDLNRFVDRQHAVVALPYCGVFVTDDRDLKKRCIAIQRVLPFTTAQVLTDEEFFRRFG